MLSYRRASGSQNDCRLSLENENVPQLEAGARQFLRLGFRQVRQKFALK
jgi:hypothetical protein